MVTQNRLRIILKAFEHRILDQSATQIVEAAERTGARVSGPIPLPTTIKRFCVIRGPHVHKKGREHFEIRTHKRIIDLYKPTEGAIENLCNLDLMAGVDVEIKGL